jgi:hypothetical protein
VTNLPAKPSVEKPTSNVVPLTSETVSPDELPRHFAAEAERLSHQSPGEYRFWAEQYARQRFDVDPGVMIAAVDAVIAKREAERKEAKADTRYDENRADRRANKEKRDREREEREERREQEKRDKEAEKAAKERTALLKNTFKEMARLPGDKREARLIELAKSLDEDIETIRDEYSDFVGPEADAQGYVEPWDSPVDGKALQAELSKQIARYVVSRDVSTVALWTAMTWVHQEAATHSPLLIVTSAEPDSGKTTLLGVLAQLVLRPYSGVELTGPNVYRIVDRMHPTLIVDEADRLFHRRVDLMHIINSGWTRGVKIPRMIRSGEIYDFDPFCAKCIGLKGYALPDTTASRGITIKMWPKLPTEKVEHFSFSDDESFLELRRKLKRWSLDNVDALKAADPALPTGFQNRTGANWKLLFAIADRSGTGKEARAAATKMLPSKSAAYDRRSEGVRLLAAIRPMFSVKVTEITSADIAAALKADLDGEWAEFRNTRSAITQRQIAALLREYEIRPLVLHPSKRSSLSRHGYLRSQFEDAFARFLSADPNIRTRS